MAFKLTEQKFNKLYPKALPGIYQEIIQNVQKAGIQTDNQLAMFIAQCAHESAGFQKFQENLNYSSEGLRKTFPKYFPGTTSQKYGYIKNRAGVIVQKADQAGIANIVYANRMGNGPAASGDGWKYRGRGVVQLTGKDNYTRFQKWLGDPEILSNPDKILSSAKLIVLTGVFFWDVNKLQGISDFVLLTKRVNGGTIGLEDRTREYKELLA